MATRHPKFVRPNLSKIKRVKNKWRRPRGIDSKQRMHLKWAGAIVGKGYRGEAVKRHSHPSGKKEFYVRNLSELERFGSTLQGFVLRLQASLSKRSKESIRKRALEMKLKVLN